MWAEVAAVDIGRGKNGRRDSCPSPCGGSGGDDVLSRRTKADVIA